MKIIKEKTVAFASCHTSDILSGENDKNLLNVISTEVYLIVASLYQQGFRTFLSDMSDGFATIGAEAVRQFNSERADIQLITVPPGSNMEPDNYLLAHSSQMICYDNGRNDAYHHAEEDGMSGINVFTILSDYLANNSPVKQALQPYPRIVGFRYCKEGILLCYLYDEKPIIVPFKNIGKVAQRDDKLYVTLTNMLEVNADILTE